MKENKALGVIRRTFTIILFIFTAVIMIFTIFSDNTFDKDEGNGVFGYKFFIVMSASMDKDFKPGDVVASKKTDTAALKEGDIITFRSVDPKYSDEIITHKIRDKTTHEGKDAFITFGSANNVEDEYPALAEKVIGKYDFRLPKLGYFFNFLKSPLGYMLLISAPFILVILLEGGRFFALLKKLKSEQLGEIEKQRFEMAEERRKNEEMLAELKAIREQLYSQNIVKIGDTSDAPADPQGTHTKAFPSTTSQGEAPPAHRETK